MTPADSSQARPNDTSARDAIITFDFQQTLYSVHAEINNETVLKHQFDTREAPFETMVYSFIHASHHLFYHHLPVDHVNFVFSTSIQSSNNQQIIGITNRLGNLYRGTNNFMAKLKTTQLPDNNRQRTLFYNIDQHDNLKALYSEFSEYATELYSYKSMTSGYDTLTRQWGTAENVMPPEELIEFIFTHNIGHIILHEILYLEKVMGLHNVFLLAILRYLNITCSIVDWDHSGLSTAGHILKAAYNDPGTIRYSTDASLEKDWDELLGIDNIVRFPVFPVTETKPFFSLNDNYQILCAANSRIEGLLSARALNFALAALEFSHDDNLYQDAQRWSQFILHFLAHHIQANQGSKVYLHHLLLCTHYLVISLLKFEAIYSLQSQRKLLLFGDHNWQKLFPQYYQAHYLQADEMKAMLASGDYLYLHVNNVPSYPDANPVIYRSLEIGVPFIGFPAAFSTPELAGFRHLEYRNKEELNSAIETINQRIKEPELHACIDWHSEKMLAALAGFKHSLKVRDQQPSSILDEYNNTQRELFLQLVEPYIANNQQSLLNFLKLLHGEAQWPIEKSRFYHRPYIQNLLAMVNQA